ncbi:MAG: hypothetical protein L0215_18750 [Gemmataceae bacterium]|nr:hypothetical protein [Gemmataceae bacterium]
MADIKVALIVTDTDRLTGQEAAVRNRLSDRGYHIHIQDVHKPIGPDAGVELIVVCAKQGSRELREMPIPVLVCNTGALFDLGMTKATPKVDFGTTDYSSLFICPDVIDHKLSGNLTGRQKITQDRHYQGWARPGSKALVAATVGGDRTKAVAFAYGKGDEMPGCAAVQRRAGFLASGDDSGNLTDAGWTLFDAAVSWAIEGGGAAFHEEMAGHWFLKDGSPSRVLSTQEYRDWVHEKVIAGLWKRLLAIVSIIGVGGILALVWYVPNNLQGNMDEKADKKFHAIEEALDKKLNKASEEQAKIQVVELFFQLPQGKGLIAELDKKAQSAFDELMKDEKTQKKLVDAAAEGLQKKGAFFQYLLDRHAELGKDHPNLDVRALILQLAFIYANKEQLPDLRATFMKSITDPKEHEALRRVALDAFPPSEKANEQKLELETVLELFSNETVSPSFGNPLTKFFTHYDDSHADILFQWLEQRVKLPATITVNAVFDAFVRMRQHHPMESKVFGRLIDWTLNHDKRKRDWGKKGLRIFDENARLDPEQRRVALRRVLNRPDVLQELISDPPSLMSETLKRLLRPDDWAFVRNEVSADEEAGKIHVQALLFNFVRRLEQEKNLSADLLEILAKMYTVRDCLYGKGTARTLEYVLQHTSPVSSTEFLKGKLEERYSGQHYKGETNRERFQGAIVLLAAIQKDANATPPFEGTIMLLKALEETAPKDPIKRELKEIVTTELQEYFSSASFVQLSREKIQEMTTSLHTLLGEHPHVRRLFVDGINRSYDNQVRLFVAAKEFDRVVEEFTKGLETNPKYAELYAKRGKVFADKLGDLARAQADFQLAIQNDAKNHHYHEVLGDILLKAKGPDSALGEYQKAVDKGGKKLSANEQGDLYRKIARAFILKDSPEDAKKFTMLAVNAYTSRLDKGRAQENLGLLALRLKDAKGALDNTELVRTKYYDNLPWNWLIRHIAAKGEGRDVVAAAAWNKWEELRRSMDIVDLHDFIPELMRKYLGIVDIIPGVLVRDKEKAASYSKNETRHTYKLEAGKSYVIDMESKVFDTFLVLHDPKGKELMVDDDGGVGLNARLEYSPKETGIYTIIATSFEREAQGAYALIIRTISK